MESKTKDVSKKKETKGQKKKSYEIPQLIVHGTLQDITQAKAGGSQDAPRTRSV
jgi:hypothetical protein